MNRNIFFLTGCPCGGKTSIGRMLAQKYDMYYFSGDGKRFRYYKLADPLKHRYMTMDTSDFWEWTLDEMIAWEKGVIAEQTPMILKDAERLAGIYGAVLFDGMLDMEQLTKAADPDRIAWLSVDRDACERDFFARGDHSGMVDAIMNTPGISGAEKERRISMRKSAAIGAFWEDPAKYGIRDFRRDDAVSPEERAEQVAEYFSLRPGIKRNRPGDGAVSLQQISKYLSMLLRHRPQEAGIRLDEHGWADVQELIAGVSRRYPLDMDALEEIVDLDEKGRYSFSPDRKLIRANQGHSIPVDVELEEKQPPQVLWHGTGEKSAGSIDRQGLLSMHRLYVHLSADTATAEKVGRRHGRPVIYQVDAGRMYRDGYRFFLSVNGVWLTKKVPPEYLTKMPDAPAGSV